jgi:hypothetical protein
MPSEDWNMASSTGFVEGSSRAATTDSPNFTCCGKGAGAKVARAGVSEQTGTRTLAGATRPV